MNIGVLRDLCSLLAKFGMKEADFINMGKMSYFVNKEEGLGKDLGSHSNVQETAEGSSTDCMGQRLDCPLPL